MADDITYYTPAGVLRMLPEQEQRVETGVTQFGDDWPGVFIRGDDAYGYAMALRSLLDVADRHELGWAGNAYAQHLARLLDASHVARHSTTPLEAGEDNAGEADG